MEKRLDSLRGHLVVCGFGRMGRPVAEEFSLRSALRGGGPRPQVLEGFPIPHGIPLAGDATADEVLRRAGIDRARTLVTLAASDADNLFITMSAADVERVFIVAPAEGEGAEGSSGGRGEPRGLPLHHRRPPGGAGRPPPECDRLHRARHPDRTHRAADRGGRGARGERPVGRPAKACPDPQELGLIIVAIKRPEGTMLFNPAPEAELEAGDP